MRALRNAVALVVGALLMLAVLKPRPRRRAVVSAVADVEPAHVLTHQDRCDHARCGAQAYVRALFDPKTDDQKTSAVDFCVHHFREAEARVRELAYHIIDETSRLGS